jgi:NAD(P)-dependent dehydrogenase (short-subunit alcohol dehydrogenase family)
MAQHSVALVTGASSGFGQLTATLLSARGFRVFGTSRKRVPSGNGVEMLELDVTSSSSVAACVDTVLARAGRIDVLVNNAGEAHASLVEETPLDIAMRVFDTNFWGVVRMTSAVLPSMRAQHSGRIINVGSLAGLVGVPGQGFYSASKHALEGYTEALHGELQPLNIRVVLIEPGFFRTGLHRSMSHAVNRIADYDDVRPVLESALADAITHGADPVIVGATIAAHAAGRRRRKLRYRVGVDATWVPRLKQWLPETWFFWGMHRRFRINRAATSTER